MNCLRPEHLSPEEFEHGLRAAQILIQRFPWAKMPEIETYTYTLHAGGFLTWDITRAKLWVQTQLRTGTDNVAPVNYEQFEQPTVWRSPRASAAAQVQALEDNGVERFDIPAFLRKQAD